MLGIKFQSLKPYWGLNKSLLLSMYDFNGADIFFFSFFFRSSIEDGVCRYRTVVARVSLVVAFVYCDNFYLF